MVCGTGCNDFDGSTSASRGSSRLHMAAMTRPSGISGWQVFQRMDRDIDAPIKQRILELFGENAFAADHRKRIGFNVA